MHSLQPAQNPGRIAHHLAVSHHDVEIVAGGVLDRQAHHPGAGRSAEVVAEGHAAHLGEASLVDAGGDAVLCTTVACHPQHEVVAAGFDDGLVLLAEIATGKVVPVAPPRGGGVSALAWNAAGSHLAFGTEQGFAGVIDLSKR